MVSPYLRRTQPSPPPRVRPPTPVSETTPPGTTRPNACVSRSTSAQTAPPCTEARREIGSTVTARIRVRSMTMPPSQLDRPGDRVPAAPHRDQQISLAGEVDGVDHVGSAGRLGP